MVEKEFMQVKVFHGEVSKITAEVGDWLAEHRVDIKFVTQSECPTTFRTESTAHRRHSHHNNCLV